MKALRIDSFLLIEVRLLDLPPNFQSSISGNHKSTHPQLTSPSICLIFRTRIVSGKFPKAIRSLAIISRKGETALPATTYRACLRGNNKFLA